MSNSTRKPGYCIDCKAFLFAEERDARICDDCSDIRERKLAGTYYEPGSAEQRESEINKALYDLRHGSGAFQKVVDAAKREVDETRAWANRLDAQRASDKLDRIIDDADYTFKRGPYLHLRGGSFADAWEENPPAEYHIREQAE